MNDKYLQKAMEKVPDKRTLIKLASQRARILAKGEKRPLIKNNELEFIDIALLEIAEGLLEAEFPKKEESLDFLD